MVTASWWARQLPISFLVLLTLSLWILSVFQQLDLSKKMEMFRMVKVKKRIFILIKSVSTVF